MSEYSSLNLKRYHTSEQKSPEEGINWVIKNSEIKDKKGKIISSKKGLEFPDYFSSLAIDVVGSKYFYTGDDKEKPLETSFKQLIYRVTDSLSESSIKQKILSEKEAKIFRDEISYDLFRQKVSFNSPVWFNVGLYEKYNISEKRDSGETQRESSHWAISKNNTFTNKIDPYQRPQGAACFIVGIEDHMESILNHAKIEGMLFKYGSGAGTNFSVLRGINEPLSGGGIASGELSFLRIYDIIAGRIQAGGKTRRAAKMVITNCDHPDLMRFAQWKTSEERKALHLSINPEWGPRDASDLESEAYKTVDGQNGNNSVRVTDEFMYAALNNKLWDLIFITGKNFSKEVEIPITNYKDDRYLPDKRFIKKLTNKRKIINAGEALEHICRAAYVTGDPALQFDSKINEWHTCPNSGRIEASNPCSEFMFINNSACNLASINLLKYLNQDGSFDIKSFEETVKHTIIGQEILVDHSSYPSKEIAENSHNFRPLGLGYANLGTLLMSKGIVYDSDEGRALAAAITSLMTAKAYETSADLASRLGSFKEFDKNKKPMLDIVEKHIAATEDVQTFGSIYGLEEILNEAKSVWSRALKKGKKYGFRNSQLTLLAPTGTIGFKLDVDCTGVEPLLGLQSSKGLAGGGELQRKEVPQCVIYGLKSRGYTENNLESIVDYIKENGTIINAPGLDKKDYSVFATALGDNIISVDGHLKMVAAVQPLLSGAISKTVNLPKESTIQTVKDTYIQAWKLGLKSISLYVDGAKGIQPVNIIQKIKSKSELKWGERVKPQTPTERIGWNVDINGIGIHFIVGEYSNRSPKESPADYFVNFGSAGSSFSGIYTSWAKEASRNRQRGDSLEEFIKHNLGASGPIAGMTDHPFIKNCSSIEDFFAKLILFEYLGITDKCDIKPTSEQMENLRCNTLAKRRRQEHFDSRIKFIDTVMNEGKITKVKHLYEDEIGKNDIEMGQIFCIHCGFPTLLSGANCRKCSNCGESSGCG